MATKYWLGNSPAVAQVQNYTLAGTWEANDIIRAKIGQKSFDTSAGSTVAATIAQTFVDAWNALSQIQYPEFQEITASRSGDDIILTADTAGVPFTCSLTPLESDGSPAGGAEQTIEGAAVATNGSTTTTSTGPNDWSSVMNWSDGAVPADGDTVIIENSSISILYGLSNATVDLTELNIRSTFTGTIGLPDHNGKYAEYRTTHLTLGTTAGAMTLKVGEGDGHGSGRIKISIGTVVNICTCVVFATGRGLDAGLPAFLFKAASGANHTLEAYGNSEVGVGVLAGDTATIVTLTVAGNAQVRCGTGVTLTTTNVGGRGARLQTESNITTATITNEGGTHLDLAGNVTTLHVHGGKFDYRGAGTISTANVRDGGELTFAEDGTTRVVSACNAFSGAIIRDPFKSTGGIAVAVKTHLKNVTLELGSDLTLTRS